MAKVSLKKDFKDGDKLYDYQLNDNFEIIEKGINDGNKIVWEDGSTKEVKLFRGTTEEIENKEIIDGQLIYNEETGETALDNGNKRIVTGSGNVVSIGPEKPTNPATKLWIPTGFVQGKDGKILTPYILYDNPSGSLDNIILNETSANYDYIEIFYNKEVDMISEHSTKVANPNGKIVSLITGYSLNETAFQIQLPTVLISETTITRYSNGGINIYNNRTELFGTNEIAIYRVVGYK